MSDDTVLEVEEMKLTMVQPIECPFADVSRTRQEIIDSAAECPFHKIVHESLENNEVSSEHVPLKVNFFRYQRTGATARLLKDIGGGDRVREMTTRFYAHVFEDAELSKFIFEGDGAAAHGKRLGDWIVEQMGGEGDVWTDSGRGAMRQVQQWVVSEKNSLTCSRFSLKDP